MRNNLNRVAAVLAWIIGGMGALAGGQTLLGRLPGWNVISWLPVYNFVVGVLTVLIVAPLIWRGHRYALPVGLAVFGANLAVVLILQVAFQDTVARESIAAMLLRLAVWAVIIGLLYWCHLPGS
ncbi:MAG: hypothetical protein ACK47M_13405 [Caldilinea sp.]